MANSEFVNPGYLYLIIVIALLAIWYFYFRNREHSSISIPSISAFARDNQSFFVRIRPILFVMRLAALVLIIVALARPRSVDVTSKTKKQEGIDIAMAVDISGSMLSKDLKPSRLEALKNVAINFVDSRPNDRFAIVAYSGESFTMCPITSDQKVVKNSLFEMKYGMLEDGTAIGMGLGTAINRLKDSKAKSKIIILLTDGVNNSGMIDPETASELAVENNIKVYTIGIGSKGLAPSPIGYDINGKFIYRNLPVEIDEELLQKIADKTGGKYFRATSNTKLQKIYEEIDQMQKTEIKELKFYNYHEEFRLYLIVAFAILILEFVLRRTIYRTVL